MIVALVFGCFFLGAGAGLVYLLFGVRRFGVMVRLARRNKALSWIVSLLPVLAMVLYTVRRPVVGVIVSIHLLAFWLLADLLGRLLKRKRTPGSFYWQGLFAVCVTIVYLSVGWYLAHHVVETDYTLTTEKNLGRDSLRIAQISDSHLGATFHGDEFAAYMERIQETNPDLVVVTGDFVDDDSTREDMVKSVEALGRMKTTYGVFYVFGNHDRGYSQYRDFSAQNLVQTLTDNGVRVLVDEAVELGDGVLLIGREDRSMRDRATMEELLQGVDRDRYLIVLDHQPHDFDAQAAAQVDLVLCGHTHGGQMIPVGWLGEVSGANDKTYGLETRGVTNFIVNSGISDWAIPFKTGTIAEYGIIDITQK